MQRIVLLFLAGAAIIILSVNCSKSGSKAGSGTTTAGNSDSILLNLGNNIILPSYQALATAVNALDSSIGDFYTSPNTTKLTNVQALFKNAYIAWQSASECRSRSLIRSRRWTSISTGPTRLTRDFK